MQKYKYYLLKFLSLSLANLLSFIYSTIPQFISVSLPLYVLQSNLLFPFLKKLFVFFLFSFIRYLPICTLFDRYSLPIREHYTTIQVSSLLFLDVSRSHYHLTSPPLHHLPLTVPTINLEHFTFHFVNFFLLTEIRSAFAVFFSGFPAVQ